MTSAAQAIGIQYQQGLKDMTPASTWSKGLLNNVDRPPVYHADTGRSCTPARRCPISTKSTSAPAWTPDDQPRLDGAWAFDPATTLHDMRWGEHYRQAAASTTSSGCSMISGRAPPSHFVGGYAGAVERAPARMLSAGRRHAQGHQQARRDRLEPHLYRRRTLHVDLGRATVVELPAEEVGTPLEVDHARVAHHARRPARRHPRPDDGSPPGQPHQRRLRTGRRTADRALAAKAALFDAMGVAVHLCGI